MSKKNKNDTALIGATDDMEEGGKALLFKVKQVKVKKVNSQQINAMQNVHEGEIPAFAIRYDYQCFAYLNRCGHIAIPLDYMPGEFFSDDGQTLICSTHGAEYAPDTGACLGGPCYGVGLEKLEIQEKDGLIYLNNPEYEVVTDNV